MLTGVVDWCGAGHAPRGMDVAWCRLELVLLGSRPAADEFVREYQRVAGVVVTNDVAAWDRWAALRADPDVESWSVNYAGIGLVHLDGPELRRRLDGWTRQLLDEL